MHRPTTIPCEREMTSESFPSIERRYGRPVAKWKELIRDIPLEDHLDVVR